MTGNTNSIGIQTDLIVTAIPSTAWANETAPFVAEVAVAGILATDTPDIDLVAAEDFTAAEPQLEAWGYIYKAVTKDGAITFRATEKPEVELPIQIKAVRK